MRKALTAEEIELFRSRLCAVAENLFARFGVGGVTMRQIARELGYSQTAAYRYFADKHEILAAVRTAAFNRFASRLEAAMEQKDPRADARSVGRAYLQFAIDEPDAYRLIFDVHQPNASNYPDLVEAAERARASMTSYVRALVDAGEISGDPEQMGMVFWSSAHGLVMNHLVGLIPDRADLYSLHGATMRLLLKGAAS